MRCSTADSLAAAMVRSEPPGAVPALPTTTDVVGWDRRCGALGKPGQRTPRTLDAPARTRHPLLTMTLLLTQVFALLTLVVWAGAIALVASPQLRELIRPHVTGAAAAITGTATAGSLYLSEVAGYLPCELCWTQRIFMYPIATVATIALVRRREDVWPYITPLAGIGILVSAYHIVIQRLPADTASTLCDPNNPCSAIFVERFGFITIPVMASAAFLGVLVLAWVRRATPTDETTTPQEKELIS